MRRIPREALHPALVDDYLTCAVKDEGGWLYFDAESECFRGVTEQLKQIRLAEIRERPQIEPDREPPPAKAMAIHGPGDVVKVVLEKMGYTSTGGCGCRRMQRQMNEWRWWGCWKHRRELVDWFAAKAEEQGLHVDRKSILGLIRVAWREQRQ